MNSTEPWILGFAVVLFLFLRYVLRSARFKGKLGESKVDIGASLLLDQRIYPIISDVTLPHGDGTTQIDQIIFSPFGIFVIETKNMKGWIFGDASQAQWTQVLYRRKERFRNPLRQNYRHVKVVQELLGLKPHQVFNVVVFVGSSTFKTPMPPEVVDGVVALSGYIKSKRTPVIDELDVPELISTLSHHRLEPGSRTDRKHIKNLERQGSLCPRCGKELVERTNRTTGEKFLGCTSYPACKGTRPIT